jgi:hypothetical protein
MSFVAKVRTTALSVGLVIAMTTLFSGCDSADKSTQYKPIESNILKKLGGANPGQSEAAQAKLPARLKKKQ